MSRGRLAAVSAVALWLAAVLQTGLVPYLTVFGSSPDLVLITVVVLSLYTGRAEAAIIGFVGGYLQGSLPAARLAHYITSRAITGFAIAWTRRLEYERRPLTAVIAVVLGTLLGQLLWMFLAAPKGIGAFIADTIRTAAYNGVLAVPVYALLNRILNPNARQGF